VSVKILCSRKRFSSWKSYKNLFCIVFSRVFQQTVLNQEQVQRLLSTTSRKYGRYFVWKVGGKDKCVRCNADVPPNEKSRGCFVPLIICPLDGKSPQADASLDCRILDAPSMNALSSVQWIKKSPMNVQGHIVRHVTQI
jgi:hypothetical protein